MLIGREHPGHERQVSSPLCQTLSTQSSSESSWHSSKFIYLLTLSLTLTCWPPCTKRRLIETDNVDESRKFQIVRRSPGSESSWKVCCWSPSPGSRSRAGICAEHCCDVAYELHSTLSSRSFLMLIYRVIVNSDYDSSYHVGFTVEWGCEDLLYFSPRVARATVPWCLSQLLSRLHLT